uniref:Uncharacterized protein LOC112819628 n=1 Tax=Callorhinus ursinus TaxID=34884 RepID=A0A3Q7NLW0_CALUR|nr:uncharacterized protein LOC112819628 [Callorhinus ursinus]
MPNSPSVPPGPADRSKISPRDPAEAGTSSKTWPKFSFWKETRAPLPSQEEEDFAAPIVQKTQAPIRITNLTPGPGPHPFQVISPQRAAPTPAFSPRRKTRPPSDQPSGDWGLGAPARKHNAALKSSAFVSLLPLWSWSERKRKTEMWGKVLKEEVAELTTEPRNSRGEHDAQVAGHSQCRHAVVTARLRTCDTPAPDRRAPRGLAERRAPGSWRGGCTRAERWRMARDRPPP